MLFSSMAAMRIFRLLPRWACPLRKPLACLPSLKWEDRFAGSGLAGRGVSNVVVGGVLSDGREICSMESAASHDGDVDELGEARRACSCRRSVER